MGNNLWFKPLTKKQIVVPVDLISDTRISQEELWVLLRVRVYDWGPDYPGCRATAAELGGAQMSHRQVRRYLHALERKGFIHVTRPVGGTMLIRLLPLPPGGPTPTVAPVSTDERSEIQKAIDRVRALVPGLS